MDGSTEVDGKTNGELIHLPKEEARDPLISTIMHTPAVKSNQS
jgi:hypothetical protein